MTVRIEVPELVVGILALHVAEHANELDRSNILAKHGNLGISSYMCLHVVSPVIKKVASIA